MPVTTVSKEYGMHVQEEPQQHSPYLLNERGVGTHQLIARWVTPRSRILDVGCADGYVMELLRAQKACTCVGIEVGPAAATARRAGFEVVDEPAPEAFAVARMHGPFDHVIFADVLEHMADPQPVLQAAASLLSPGGSVLVSVPNVAFLPARLRLLRGRWDYEETGIFDATHLRFFTVETARALLVDAGLRVERAAFVGPLTYRMGGTGLALTRLRPQLLANQVVLEGRFHEGSASG
jgi:methionine biosynthesis protein MetW